MGSNRSVYICDCVWPSVTARIPTQFYQRHNSVHSQEVHTQELATSCTHSVILSLVHRVTSPSQPSLTHSPRGQLMMAGSLILFSSPPLPIPPPARQKDCGAPWRVGASWDSLRVCRPRSLTHAHTALSELQPQRPLLVTACETHRGLL
jgi:hypothetical protein